jgi:RimJ/RimL family protein N-acetyltransferase
MGPISQPQPANSAPIINIVGVSVALGPLDRALLPLYVKWINDFEVSRYFVARLRPHTLEARADWYERAAKGEANVADFTVYERATLRPIGKAVLDEIDHQHGRATFGLLIGEKDCWSKGYGTEATRLMLDYGFTALGLHNVMLQVSSANGAAIRAYTKAGFRVIGARRESERLAGRVGDTLFMDCLASEFESPILAALLTAG